MGKMYRTRRTPSRTFSRGQSAPVAAYTETGQLPDSSPCWSPPRLERNGFMLRLSRASILRAITLAGALCVAAIASPAPASAGTYIIHECETSPTHSLSGWRSTATAGTSGGIPYFYASTDCANYGAYA